MSFRKECLCRRLSSIQTYDHWRSFSRHSVNRRPKASALVPQWVPFPRYLAEIRGTLQHWEIKQYSDGRMKKKKTVTAWMHHQSTSCSVSAWNFYYLIALTETNDLCMIVVWFSPRSFRLLKKLSFHFDVEYLLQFSDDANPIYFPRMLRRGSVTYAPIRGKIDES